MMVVQPIKPELSTGLQQRIDAMVDALLPEIETRQERYFDYYKRYFQGLRTHGSTPADGIDAEPFLTAKPTDQTESWQDFGIPFPSAMPACLEMHVYDGPKGKGYVIIITVREGGELFRRAIHHGSETWREQAWHHVAAPFWE